MPFKGSLAISYDNIIYYIKNTHKGILGAK
nr:MAG TPA: hypothetical protein [Caudoviricetes sp.]